MAKCVRKNCELPVSSVLEAKQKRLCEKHYLRFCELQEGRNDNLVARINSGIPRIINKKKKGHCCRNNCHNLISGSDVANEMRLCDRHYRIYEENRNKQFKKNVRRIADRIPSARRIRKIVDTFSCTQKKEEYLQRKVTREWMGYSKKRRFRALPVMQSREWLNTQALMRRKEILCCGHSFMNYIRDVFNLYSVKLLHSREYLKKNAYKKQVVFNRDTGKVICLKIDVVYLFNLDLDISVSSKDVALIPEFIRKKVFIQKRLLKKELVRRKVFPVSSLRKLRVKVKTNKNSGIYTKLKKENTPAAVTQFMSELKNMYTKNTYITHHYKKIDPPYIASILPLYYLAQQEYMRIYPESECHLFLRLKQLWTSSGINLELLSFLALYFLMLNEGSDFLRSLSEWVGLQERTYKSPLDHFPEEFQELFSKKLNVNFSEKKKLAKLYNSCFTHNVIEYDEKSNKLLPVIKNPVI
ncbi:hypothetical protein AA471_27215 [Salmonella enterica subsp. enterica]|nr:hypothetical protein [Salmonella enterica subsp. enterica]ECI0980912.1 hypothetical protein [Salmonella enterica subsp. enterica serovar Newport]ECO1013808.1 hypothetical protein [Salmonella enterica subsp. enterica serovar Newport]EDQ2991790.1 hypothetical protein [Salmonella enterica subsp. enterica]